MYFMRGLSRPASLILLALHLASVDAWCCRACAKCMCTVYGVCPSNPSGAGDNKSQSERSTPLKDFTVDQVVAFVDSITPRGVRDTCTPGCQLIEYFNSSLFRKHAIRGEKLFHFFANHEARFTKDVIHNTTARADHSIWLASHGFFPDGLKGEQYLALTTRLRDALRDAGAIPGRSRRLRAALS